MYQHDAPAGNFLLRNTAIWRVPFVFSFLLIALLLLAGCARKNEDFIPAPELAENALVQVLEAWKAGQPAGEIPNTKPAVFATDTNRLATQTLRAYDVLGETPGSSGRTYVVVLKLENPTEEIKTTYIVVGIDPLWVFRREDYELLMHWDHYMPETAEPVAE